MPLSIDAHTVVTLDRAQIFARFPAPEPELALAVTAGEELSVGAEREAARIPLIQMSTKCLALVWLEATVTVVDDNLVVHALAEPVASSWVHRGRWYRVHSRVTDVLGHDGYAELPQVDLLILGR